MRTIIRELKIIWARKGLQRLRYFVLQFCTEVKHVNLLKLSVYALLCFHFVLLNHVGTFRSALKCMYCLTTLMDSFPYPKQISKTRKMLNHGGDNELWKYNPVSKQVNRKKWHCLSFKIYNIWIKIANSKIQLLGL